MHIDNEGETGRPYLLNEFVIPGRHDCSTTVGQDWEGAIEGQIRRGSSRHRVPVHLPCGHGWV